MTLKEAVLKSLEDISILTNYMEVYNKIIEKKYYDFGSSKTPSATISAALGDFIRNGDSRVKRIKKAGGTYSYYLTKNEQNIPIEALSAPTDIDALKKSERFKSYDERDLHRLVSSYLKSTSVYSKTIFHEQSTYAKDNNQIWTPSRYGRNSLSKSAK